jgi:hypothetical protein
MSKFICERIEKCFLVESVPVMLTELGFKDLVADIIPNTPAGETNSKLPYRDWSALIPYVKYEGYKGDTLKFIVPNRYNSWPVYIKFDSFYDMVADTSLNCNEAARLLFWGSNLRCHCSCPAFAFWGHNFVLTQLDSAIHPETRFPHIRNPELKGSFCKHLRKVMMVIPFKIGVLAACIRYERAHGKKPLEVKPDIE